MPRRPAADPQAIAAVEHAIASRRSIRAFLPTPVPRETLEALLALAARAPSGSNVQPWQVHVLTGDARQALSDAILDAYRAAGGATPDSEPYPYYPRQWVEPYLARRRKVGWDLYGLLGIGKGDRARMQAQHGRNYLFFDAPVALVFTIDGVMEQGSWLDYGMFLQTLMIAARAHGLDTCPQAALNPYQPLIARHLGLAEGQRVVCCMALGHADPAAPENALHTERAALADFVRFHEALPASPAASATR